VPEECEGEGEEEGEEATAGEKKKKEKVQKREVRTAISQRFISRRSELEVTA
jgi:hypothetical protein